MNHKQFRKAREKLGLSVRAMAELLGVHDIQVRRMEARPELISHRPVAAPIERLIAAYLSGYRPKDWPRAAKGGAS